MPGQSGHRGSHGCCKGFADHRLEWNEARFRCKNMEILQSNRGRAVKNEPGGTEGRDFTVPFNKPFQQVQVI